MTAIEKDTNQLYRQKYFVDARKVLRYRPPAAAPSATSAPSTVIPSEQVRVSDVRVPMNGPAPPEDAPISVRVVRKSTGVSFIHIACPCGRHAELEMEHPVADTARGHMLPQEKRP